MARSLSAEPHLTVQRRPGAWAAFWIMTLLATAVGGYALTYLFTGPGHAPVPLRASRILVPAVFLTHVATGGLALLIGPWQFVGKLRSRYPAAHRRIGWLYTVACLASGAAGFFLAFRTFAGPVAGLGFGLLAIVWIGTTGMTVVAAIRRAFAAHRRWAILSYALTLSGVTLRIYLGLALAADLPFRPAYIAIAWACWVPNLLIALAVVRSSGPKKTRKVLSAA